MDQHVLHVACIRVQDDGRDSIRVAQEGRRISTEDDEIGRCAFAYDSKVVPLEGEPPVPCDKRESLPHRHRIAACNLPLVKYIGLVSLAQAL